MASSLEKLAFLNDRLARRRGFLETVLQSIQEGVLVVSAEGAAVYANRTAEAMLGFEFDRVRGRPLERWLPGVPVVRDGNLITGTGPGTAALFALEVLCALGGPADAVAEGMLLR